MLEGYPAGPYDIRLVAPFNQGNKEICADLPHLHQSHIERRGWQPGNPGSSALGSSTVQLYPPGTEGYANAKVYYDQIARYQRVEWYVGGKLYDAGIITGIRKAWGSSPVFELTIQPDYVLAHKSAPFPGELLSNDVTSAILKSYLGTNELGASDGFNPFTAANYTSTTTPGGGGPGTWSGTTDDGFNVVSCTLASAINADLISKTGAAANDRWHSHFIEITGRLSPSSDANNAGIVGLGLSNSSSSLNDCTLAYVNARKINGRYTLNAFMTTLAGGSGTVSLSIPNLLGNQDDPQGMIPLTIGLLVTLGGNSNGTATTTLFVNGKAVMSQVANSYDPGTSTRYPFIHFGGPATGTATCYLTNFNQFTRFTPDGPSTASVFGLGTISTSTVSLGYGVDPASTFLEVWSRLATRNGWYWRYTPQPYVIGTRTLGTVDFAADPGTDRGTNKSVVFSSEDGTLANLELNNNVDPLAAGIAASGQSTVDGGGIAYWNDPATLSKYGVIQEEVLAFTHSDFNSQRRAAFQISQSKINVDTAGSKMAVINRDPQTADVWRELDKVMLEDPELNVNELVARVLAYSVDENQPLQPVTLDYFTEDEF